MHRLDNIFSSSVYGFVFRFAPERGQMPYAPPKLVSKRAIFGYFFANGPFRNHLRRGVGHLAPLRGESQNEPYTDELQILSSLCMQMHDFATAVKGATTDQLRDRVGCAYLIYTVQGVRAAGLQLAPLINARI